MSGGTTTCTHCTQRKASQCSRTINEVQFSSSHSARNNFHSTLFGAEGFGQTAFYTRKHSQGQTTWPKQFADLDFFTKLVYDELVAPEQTSRPRYFLMGHSMGGAVVLASQTRPVRLDHADLFDGGVVSTSPLLRQAPGVKAPQLVVKLGNLVGRAFPTLALPAAVKPEDTCRDERVQREYAQDKLCLQRGSFGGVGSMLVGGQALVDRDFARWPKHVPVLVCHGEADLVTDHRASQEFVEKLKDKVRVDDATYKGFEGFYASLSFFPFRRGDESSELCSRVDAARNAKRTGSRQARLYQLRDRLDPRAFLVVSRTGARIDDGGGTAFDRGLARFASLDHDVAD